MLNKKRGFTLIELLVVIAIIGILAGLLITGISSARQKAKNIRIVQEFNQIGLAAQLYFDKNGTWPSISQIVTEGLYPTSDAGWYCTGCTYSFRITPNPITQKYCGLATIRNSANDGDVAYKYALCITNGCTSCGVTVVP